MTQNVLQVAGPQPSREYFHSRSALPLVACQNMGLALRACHIPRLSKWRMSAPASNIKVAAVWRNRWQEPFLATPASFM